MARDDWRIPEKVAREHAMEFQDQQYNAFLAGFKAAAAEGESFSELRNWLETQRDNAQQRIEESEDGDDMMFARRMAFVEVLVKLSEMGCHSEETDQDGDRDE